MSVRIIAIASYIPKRHVRAKERAKDLEFNITTLNSKIGTERLPVKDDSEDTSDLAVKAVKNIIESGRSLDDIDGIILCTQNPDGHGLPHTSAIIHKKLNLKKKCMCFDISLGCSGFVHGLAIVKGIMESFGLKNMLLLTADPYSKIVNINDVHTSLIFGDGACATWITNDDKFSDRGLEIGEIEYYTDGSGGKNLEVNELSELYMNGREVFFFAAKVVPDQIRDLLSDASLEVKDIHTFIFHQGSKYIVETIAQKIGVEMNNVPLNINEYGNLVSSSIPMILKDYIGIADGQKIVISGFGVGLSAASMILES